MPNMTQIKASAGSGKTYTLTREFLQALATTGTNAAQDSGADWRSIMAITFTNAAAAEMQDRVIKCLKQIALKTETDQTMAHIMSPDRAKLWLDIILRDRSSLNISTIDSLLYLILRMSALSMELPPDFKQVFANEDILNVYWEEYSDTAWANREVSSTEAGTETGGGAAGVAARPGAGNWRRIRSICRTIVANERPDRFSSRDSITTNLISILPFILTDRLQGRTPLEQFLTRDGGGLLPPLRQRVRDLLRIIIDGESSGVVYKSKFLSQMVNALDALNKALSVSDNTPDLKDFAAMRVRWDEIFKSTYFYKDEVETKQKSGPVPETVSSAYQELQTVLQDLHCLESMYRQASTGEEMLKLAQSLFARYREEIRARGQIFSDRIPVLVKNLLVDEHGQFRGVSDALCRLGTRIRHFLVDEFQDTSRSQWDALRPLVAEALSSGGSFTWVGDVKQAIYGFRGGDSQLFDEVREEQALTVTLQDGRPAERVLPINYRSKKEVVDFNNALFTPLEDADVCQNVLGAYSKAVLASSARCGEVPHALEGADPETPLMAYMARALARAYKDTAQALPGGDKSGGHVHICSFSRDVKQNDDDEDGDEVKTDAQATAVGEIVRARGARPWADYLVLVRKNGQATNLARHLSTLGIPVVTENSLILAEHPLIVQTTALLDFLRAPANDVAFWTMIAGSLMGYDPKTGHAAATNERTDPLAEQDRVNAIDLELFALSRDIKNKAGETRETLADRWQRAHPEFWAQEIAPLLQAGASLSPYDLVSEWYAHINAARRFTRADPFLRRFLEVLTTSARLDLRSLGDFMDFWGKHGAEEKLPMPQDLDAVKIMTIHKSKGLQAKVVIVPWTSTSTSERSSKLDLVEYVPRSGGAPVRAVCKPDAKFPAAILSDLRAGMEIMNRYYVAFTRAEEELYVFVSEAPAGDGLLLDTLLNVARERDTAKTIPQTVPWEEESQTLLADSAPDADQDTEHADQADEEDEADNVDTDAIIPEEAACAVWTPMDWMPGLRLHFEFMDESHPRDVAREEGVFTHGCLEQLARLPSEARDDRAGLARAIERLLTGRARRTPWLAQREGFLDRTREELHWFAGLARRWGWLDNALSEQSLTDRGENMRMDLMTRVGGRTLVLDYKSGLAEERYQKEHHHQVNGYLACLMQAWPAVREEPLGVVVYLHGRRLHLVLPGGRSWKNGHSLNGAEACTALLNEEEFAEAMASFGLAPRTHAPGEPAKMDT